MKQLTKTHKTVAGKTVTRKLVFDDKDEKFIKELTKNIHIDIHNDSPKVCHSKFGMSTTLTRAVIKNRNLKTKRKAVRHKNGNPYDVRIENLIL
jgi:hypothetical protein